MYYKIFFLRDQKAFLFFILIVILLFFHYDFHKLMFYRPQSVHCWRQADCASQALNYYQNGMNFFKPELHGMVADNKTTGYCAEEFPVFYYFVAILYKIFGYHEFIFRLFNVLVFLTGLIFLFKSIKKITQSNFWSVAISVLFFTSPVLNYYANNFVINTAALALTIIGWYYFIVFYKDNRPGTFKVALLFFTLATLIKISEAITLFALLGIYFIELFNIYHFRQKQKLFNQRDIILFIISFLLVFAWYLYAHLYNSSHNQLYYFFNIRPIWALNKEEISEIWWHISHRWSYDYFNVSVLVLFLTLFIYNLIRIKKCDPFLCVVSIIIFIGSILFCLLWFSNLQCHDYYVISIYITFIMFFFSFFSYSFKHDPPVMNSLIIKLVFIAFLIHNINYARNQVLKRYKPSYSWINYSDTERYSYAYKITPYLRAIGIKQEDKVIFIPDITPCYSLYLINQKGYNEFCYDNTDSLKIAENIKRGAKYLILAGNELLERPYIKPFSKYKIGERGNIHIFNLSELNN